MKRVVYLFLMFMIASVSNVYGWYEKSIKFDNRGHDKETFQTYYCNVTVKLQQGKGDGQYGISLEIENTLEKEQLCLFNLPYSARDLKSNRIVFHKRFPTEKGKGKGVDACDKISSILRLRSSETYHIFTDQTNEKSIEYTLPIYIAQYEVKNFFFFKLSKIVLVEFEKIKLHIDIEEKADEDLERLSAEADILIAEIEDKTFCLNENHKGDNSKESLEGYKKKVEELKERGTTIVTERNYMFRDNEYQVFKAICEKLDNIQINTVSSCSHDKVAKARASHNCNYCSWSAEEIYEKLQSYAIDLHNGKLKKEQVQGKVEAMYKCAQKNKRRNAGKYMSGITDFYKRIKNKY